MAGDNGGKRLRMVARDFNVGVGTILDFLQAQGVEVQGGPNAKVDGEIYALIAKEFRGEAEKYQVKNTPSDSGDETPAAPQTVGEALRIPESKEEVTTTEMEGVRQPEAETAGEREVEPSVPSRAAVEQPAQPVETEKEQAPLVQLKVKGQIDLSDLSSGKGRSKNGRVQGKAKADGVAPETNAAAEPSPDAVHTEKSSKPVEVADEPAVSEAKESEVAQAQEPSATPEKHTEETAPVKGEAAQPENAEGEEASVAQESKEVVLTKTPREQELLDTKPSVKVVGTIDLTQMSDRRGRGGKRKSSGDDKVSGVKTATEQKVEVASPSSPASKKGAEPIAQRSTVKEERKREGVSTQVPSAEGASASGEASTVEEGVSSGAGAKDEIFRPAQDIKLSGPTVVGKVDLSVLEDRSRRKPEVSVTTDGTVQKRRRRRRLVSDASVTPVRSGSNDRGDGRSGRKHQKAVRREVVRPEISREEVEEKLKETRARLADKRSNSFGKKYRKEKRSLMEARREEEFEQLEQARKTLTVSEFATVNELAGMMDVPVVKVIEACMNMGLIVTINHRLDAESMALVADEFGFKTEFVDLDELSRLREDQEEEEREEDLEPRIPVVALMGHVDHGKTKLCDAINKSNVIESEAGGITQHMNAYFIKFANGRAMTLLDTPGHESFTSMRARGAKLTDIVIIIISAEDGVMPQTKEAISQASLMDAKLVFAINKIDSPNAHPEKVKEQLANMNYLVEDWGGKYQCQEISAKQNINVDLLLEKVFLEADLLELKANPNRMAEATVIESSVDKGRGHVANILVQNGTLRVGDCIVSGGAYGRVKSLINDKGKEIEEAGPSIPVKVMGLNGSPQAGDSFVVVENDKEARNVASKIRSIRRQQEMHVRKHITLDEIGRRIAIGNFQELNLVVKADVDGSSEALSDALLALSTDEIQVNIISRGVGQITEGDVTTAMTSNAVIVGFQVRPSVAARKMAENEQIEIRLYSVIYEAIEEVRSAMEGMLSPELKEEITGSAEVLETFRISKVGTVAGCMVTEGKLFRSNKVRIIRDGIVVYDSELASLKRFKDEVREVLAGQECGVGVKNYNDIKVGDILESYKETEVKRTL